MNMLAFFADNLATILVGLVVLGIVAAIVVVMIKKKKSGKMIGCGCSCGSCPHASEQCKH
jgi:hypothetical protein